MRSKPTIAISALSCVVSIIGIIAATKAALDTSEELRPVLISMVVAVAAIILTDRVVDLIRAYMDKNFDQDEENYKQVVLDFVKDFPTKIADNILNAKDIISFSTKAEGVSYCIYLSQTTRSLKNIAFRHDGQNSVTDLEKYTEEDLLYLQWIEAKKKILSQGTVSELLSAHFHKLDPVRRFAEGQKSNRYHFKCVSNLQPVVQVSIFDFKSQRPKQLVLGWEIPGQEQGISFASSHPELVRYFETYFDNNFKDAPGKIWLKP